MIVQLAILVILIILISTKSELKGNESGLKANVKAITAVDPFEKATIYDYHLGDMKTAQKYYAKAISKAVERKDPKHSALTIRVLDRLAAPAVERDEHHRDAPIDNDLARAIQLSLEQPPPPNIKQVWVEDSQNVHDSILNNTASSHYQYIKNNFDQPTDDIPAISAQLTSDKAKRMLQYIQEHSARVSRLNDDESNIVKQVWKVSKLGEESKKTFEEALEDSWAEGTPVCITGRTTRLIASLAHLVPQEPQLGILKTSNAIRNEIMNTCAKIMQDNETDSEEQLKKRFDIVIDTYVDLPEMDKQKIKEECAAAVI